MTRKRILTIALLLLVILALAACGKTRQQTVKMVVTADNISQLEDYPNLKEADLTGSTCYDAILAYMKKHPDVKVIYTVDVGGTQLSSTSTELTLKEGSYDFDTLLKMIRYLPKATSLEFPMTKLTEQQMDALAKTRPDLAIGCTLDFDGMEVHSYLAAISLAGVTSDRVDYYAQRLGMFPRLKMVELVNCELSFADIKKLKDAAPQAEFTFPNATFQLFGKTVSLDATKVELVNVNIGDEGEAELREALSMLSKCTYFKLDNCGLSNEVLAKLRVDFPHTEIVWRVYQTNKNRSWLTDTEVLRSVKGVNNQNSEIFKYCTKVKYLDLGQNPDLTDISFLSYMPNLEIVILSESAITDLSPLAGCKKLSWLELAKCGGITDVSPLKTCENLKYLNLSHTKAANVAELKGLKLELLYYVNSGKLAGLTESDWTAIKKLFTNCTVTYSPLSNDSADAYGTGWRYNNDKTYTAAYKKVRSVFDYDSINQGIPGGNTGPTGDAAVKTVTKVVTAETISQLEKYINLEEANLSGSTCYEAILAYMRAHPNVKVIFTIPMGGSSVKNTTVNLTLKQGEYEYDVLMERLKYVTSLKTLNLPATTLTSQQISGLRTKYTAIGLNYTMQVDGAVLNDTVRSVDLSAMEPGQISNIAAQLNSYPNIVWVELMDANGKSKLSIADVKKLQAACPKVIFHYSFTLFGKTISTTDDKVEFVKVSIGDSGEAKIREALDILSGCTYFKLDNCGLSNEVLAKIRDDYPKTKVVWRVFQTNANRSWLTDTEVLRAVYHVNDSNSHVFKYCTEVKYLDFGHNTSMTDLSFMAYMPNLEIAILSGSPIKDLSPLANCKKLVFLELAWCGNLKDISPLAQCESLRNLNLGHTRVKDLSPLYGLNMEMLSFVNSGNRVSFTEAHWQEIQENMPTCWITFNPLFDSDATPYGTGWRYKSSGGFTAIYRKVRDVFNYDEIDKVLQGNK